MKNLPIMSRRVFLKQKFMVILYTFMSQYFTPSLFNALPESRKNAYAILDRLLEIPFSPVVREELHLRVGLQKKYCFDANGFLNPLDRFLREIVHFVVYHKNEDDFALLYRMQDAQVDYAHLLQTVVKLEAAKSLKIMPTATHTTKRLDYHDSPKRDANKMQVQTYCFTKQEYLLNLYAIIYNSVCDLYLNALIDDFSVDLDHTKVFVSVWNHQDVYDIAFYKIFTSILRENGFMSWSEQLKDIDSDKLLGEEGFFMHQDAYHDSIDHYGVLHMEVL